VAHTAGCIYHLHNSDHCMSSVSRIPLYTPAQDSLLHHRRPSSVGRRSAVRTANKDPRPAGRKTGSGHPHGDARDTADLGVADSFHNFSAEEAAEVPTLRVEDLPEDRSKT